MTRTELWNGGFLPLGSRGIDVLGEKRLTTWYRRRGGVTELLFLEPEGPIYDLWAWSARRMPRRLRTAYFGMGFSGGLPDPPRFPWFWNWLLRGLGRWIKISIRDETTGLFWAVNARSDALRRRG